MTDSPTEKQPPHVLDSDTENATQVRPDEAPTHKRHKFSKFRAYNTGLWNGPKRENTEQIRRQDDLHRYDAIAGQLDLTDQQKQRGRRLFDDLDFHDLGTPIDSIIFAVCIVVANADADGKRYWPHPKTAGNDSLFVEMADSLLDMSWKQEVSLIQRVKHRVPL